MIALVIIGIHEAERVFDLIGVSVEGNGKVYSGEANWIADEEPSDEPSEEMGVR